MKNKTNKTKTTIKNETTGQEIHLAETDDVVKLENQLVLLGMNGLFYSPLARDIKKKIKEIKDKQFKNKQLKEK